MNEITEYYLIMDKYNFKIKEHFGKVSEHLYLKRYEKINEISTINSEDYFSVHYFCKSKEEITQKIKYEMYEIIFDHINNEIDNFNRKIENANKNENILNISRLKKIKKIL